MKDHAPNKLLSIVVPVYNIEKHVGNCLASTLEQNISLEDYEIIIVDDGSTDGSPRIIADFAEGNKNIIVITKKNGGLGSARKSGLEKAQGTYIYFLDGDDYLAHNSLDQVLSFCAEQNLDIAGFGVKRTTELNMVQTDSTGPIKLTKVLDGIEFIAHINEYRVEVWWYLIKREFLLETGLKFEDKRFVNDSYFTPMLFVKAKRTAFFPMDIYRYVERGDSITKKKSNSHYKKHIADSIYAIEKMQHIIQELELKENPNLKTVQKIRIKQESYTLFSLIRFAKSDINLTKLEPMLTKLKGLNSYPVKNLRGREYSGFVYKFLTLIMNNKLLLIIFIRCLRFYLVNTKAIAK